MLTVRYFKGTLSSIDNNYYTKLVVHCVSTAFRLNFAPTSAEVQLFMAANIVLSSLFAELKLVTDNLLFIYQAYYITAMIILDIYLQWTELVQTPSQ